MVTSDSKTQLHMESETNKKPNNKLWILLCSVLVLCCTGLVIGIIVLAIQEETAEPEVCDTAHCVMTAGKLLENINPEMNPCDNFYEFACGGWLKRTVIPEDSSSYSIISVLRKKVEGDLKELFERETSNEDVNVITKAKNMYASCVDLGTIENRDADPLVTLLNALGGWPVLGSNNGGNWDETDYDLETLMGRLLGEFDNHNIVTFWVGEDETDSSRHVLKIDQPSQGMPSRDYYLKDQYAHYKKAYLDYMIAIAMMLGADPTTAQNDMNNVLEYETKLANLSRPIAERREYETLYNPTTIQDLMEAIPQIDWKQVLDIALPEEITPLPNTEKIINRSPVYLANAARLTEETEKRVVANYLIWSFTKEVVSTLSKRFRDAEQVYNNALYGTSSISARWRKCVDFVSDGMNFATGRMYVAENFKGDSKHKVEEMVTNLKTAFKELLEHNEWMDEETKVIAKEKCDDLSAKIGYPDWIFDDGTLNDYYSTLKASPDQYFENKLSFDRWYVRSSSIQLRETVVDRYLNYGGIGMMIGRLINLGFGDIGRRFDQDGSLKPWWSNETLKNFEDKGQCIIKQYGQFVMPENNEALNGIKTLELNIADIGGFKKTFKAYVENELSNLKLPGISEYTPQQLLSINFGQTQCSAYTPEGADRQILESPVSPDRYRVIGAAQNVIDFANAFNCPADSYMNPPEKCIIW